ncbi:hypothetical protein AB0F81_16275 [Actinoplanes sp. NPDC024001]|uniref:hypothetical protein n=1 Tax=Actinoplanes sp. NPDC024001 TaxID=3154598 RepID=UPI00340F08CC
MDGRTQDAAGRVRLRLSQEVTGSALGALDAEASRLTGWLEGFRVPMIYRSPGMAG